MTDEPYSVGKGKPPREHQFKKGGKAGPGRPKGSRGKSDYDKLLDERIVVGEDRLGRPIRKSWRHIVNVTLLKKAGQGDIAAIRLAKEFEYKAMALAVRNGPPPLTLAEERQRERDEEQKKELSGSLSQLLVWVANLKRERVLMTVDGKLVLAPWAVKAFGDYRIANGAPRVPGPGGCWSPHADDDDLGPKREDQ